jgi:hypothetical protein
MERDVWPQIDLAIPFRLSGVGPITSSLVKRMQPDDMAQPNMGKVA